MVEKFYPYAAHQLNRIEKKIGKKKKLNRGERDLLTRISSLARRAKVQRKYKPRKHRR